MERREFLTKSILAAASVAVAPAVLSAGTKPYSLDTQDGTGLAPTIISDETRDGIRYVSAAPCAKVCSKQIDIQINTSDNTIKACAFTRGCPGNALGLCSLLKDMEVAEAIRRLDGTQCANRGTSCPDQLARVLKMILA